MTVQECYNVIGNYDEVSARLGSERLIRKYLDKFRADDSLECLCSALESEDYEQAFLCIHNLKGLYLNLSLSQVVHSSVILCEMLRHGAPEEDITPFLEDVKRDHDQAVETINELLNS